MVEKYGPLVRLWGIHPTQIPSSAAKSEALTPLLNSILLEALPFISEVPTSSPVSRPWKSKGVKQFPRSTAPVHVYERVVSAKDLRAVAEEYHPPHVDPVKVQLEAWAFRRSVHEDAPERGTAAWDEWVRSFKDKHAETEKEFTPMILSTTLREEWDCSGMEVEVEGGDVWESWTLKLEESVHKMPAPLRNRVFPVLQATCAARGRREFLVVQLAVRDPEAEAQPGPEVRGAYTSVERLRETGDDTGASVEWVMGTTSDARGVLPAWVQRATVPGFIAKDVDMFLGWIATERKGKRKMREGEDSEATNGGTS